MIGNASAKPAKGTALLERRASRRAIELAERLAKEQVRRRDKTCRWPRCECRALKHIRLEVAHLDDKGMGGDHGERTHVEQMILLCFLKHQGATSLHSGDARIVPQTDQGTSGPCDFLLRNDLTGELELVAAETTIGISEERNP